MKILPVATLFIAALCVSCATLTRKGSTSFSDNDSPYANEKSTSTTTSPKPKSTTNKSTTGSTPKPKPTPKAATTSATATTPAMTAAPAPTTAPAPTKEIVVRQEKVKVVENNTVDKNEYNYYIIMGSFRIIENARNYSSQLISEGFQPIIFENESGLFRISVGGNNQETTIREKIADIRSNFPQHADVWLLNRKQ